MKINFSGLNNESQMYQEQDITERLLQKLDISLYLHNPSYCGRAAADALFNPEFLSRFHILSVGQTASRSHRENLSPELTRVFYGKNMLFYIYLNFHIKIRYASWELQE